MIAWDLETTSKDVNDARIWEFATWPGGSTLIDPMVEIPPEIIELCHLDPAKLEAIERAPLWGAVADELVGELLRADAIVTQNGPRYDVPVLGNTYHGIDVTRLPPVFDVRVLAFEAWPNLANHKLITLAEHVGLGDVEDMAEAAHAADFDCKLTMEVFQRLPTKWIADLARLHEFQGRAAKLQADDWERYGVTPDDGPRFLWFRTCRVCMGGGCLVCARMGILHHTRGKKETSRRGSTVERGYLDWLRKMPSCPKAFRGDR